MSHGEYPDPLYLLRQEYEGSTYGEYQELGNGRFVVTETRPSGETFTVAGRINGPGSTTTWRMPNLDAKERAVFERVKAEVLPKVMAAQEAGEHRFDLLRMTDYPELFPNLDLHRNMFGNSAGSTGSEGRYLKVVQALNDLMDLLGYQMSKGLTGMDVRDSRLVAARMTDD